MCPCYCAQQVLSLLLFAVPCKQACYNWGGGNCSTKLFSMMVFKGLLFTSFPFGLGFWFWIFVCFFFLTWQRPGHLGTNLGWENSPDWPVVTFVGYFPVLSKKLSWANHEQACELKLLKYFSNRVLWTNVSGRDDLKLLILLSLLAEC